MDLGKFLIQLGLGFLWQVIAPQIPFILSAAGVVVGFMLVNHILRIWGGSARE